MAKRKRKKQVLSTDFDIPSVGPDVMEEMFINSLVESDVLAEEPEFKDLYFDEDEAYASASNTHRKYKRKLAKAKKKGRRTT